MFFKDFKKLVPSKTLMFLLVAGFGALFSLRAQAQSPTPTPTPTPPPANYDVIPLVSLVTLQPADETMTVSWGYINKTNAPITIEYGENNQTNFSFKWWPQVGPTSLTNQPTVFAPGRHERAWTTVVDLTQYRELSWWINGVVTTATPLDAINQPYRNGFRWQGDWNAETIYAPGDVVLYEDEAWIARASNFELDESSNTPPPENDFMWIIFGANAYNGADGRQGAQGLPGETGEQGPEGERGLIGETGPKGETGDIGPKGENGDIGATGDTGSRGSTGPQGPVGERGPKAPLPAVSAILQLPPSGTLRIDDARVKMGSVVYAQYVGGNSLLPPLSVKLSDGQLLIIGFANRQFRYVVFN